MSISGNRVTGEMKKTGKKDQKLKLEQTGSLSLWMTERLRNYSGSQRVGLKCPGCPSSRVLYWTDRRYENAPQVLCKEGLRGRRGYWEVEYEGWVVVGVVYTSSGRKAKDGECGLGENDSSWALGWGGSHYQAWHDGESVEVPGNRSNTIGIYVDHPAGVVAFYLVDGEPREARLLHRYKTCFTDELLPGFWVGLKSQCWIRRKD